MLISLVFGGWRLSIIPVMRAKAPSYRRRSRLTGEGRYPVIVSAKGGLFHWAPPRNEPGVTTAGETDERLRYHRKTEA